LRLTTVRTAVNQPAAARWEGTVRIPKDQKDQQNGIVAILDALGASNYTDAEIRRFMRSREKVLDLLSQRLRTSSEISRRR